jgi:MYXO-CTERM domain-containing protein
MRGFFVFKQGTATPATPVDPTIAGMQQVYGNDGDTMTLEARVYNYSFTGLPSSAAGTSKVHVRFYYMPWNKANGKPTDPTGASTLIGETTLNDIPPFTPGGSIPNYVLASVAFPLTDKEQNKDLAFWVVAWAEDPDGHLLTELPAHGLTSDPSALGDGARFTDYTDLEQMVPAPWATSDGGVPMQSFSNNIGFYNQLFHVNPTPSNSLAASAPGDVRSLAVSKVHSKETSLVLGEPTNITATVHNNGKALQTSNARFYDGDPDHGGTFVGEQHLTYMNPGDDHAVSLRYAPTTCGTHDFYMSVWSGGIETQATKAVESVNVTCPGPMRSDAGADAGGGGSPGGGSRGGGCSVAPGSGDGLRGGLAPLFAAVAAFFTRRRRGK